MSVDIPEFNEIKTDKHFEIKHLSLDNSLETYNTTSFPKFDIFQDNELFNLWDFDDVEMMSLNPEYKYKYPKLTKSEFMRQEWQSQEGVPNKLNQFLRAEEAGTSIQEIKEMDNDYQAGLGKILTEINEEAEKIKNILQTDGKNDVILTEAQKDHLKEEEEKIKEKRFRTRLMQKQYNPVLIKPALNTKDFLKKLERERDLIESLKNTQVHLKPKFKYQQEALQNEIKDGKLLNPTPNQPPKQPSTDLTPEQIEQNKDAFKKAIAEGKQNLKNKKAENMIKRNQTDTII